MKDFFNSKLVSLAVLLMTILGMERFFQVLPFYSNDMFDILFWVLIVLLIILFVINKGGILRRFFNFLFRSK